MRSGLRRNNLSRHLVENSYCARPTRRSLFYLHRKAGNLEPRRRQYFQVVQLLDVTIANLATRLVTFPDQLGILGFGVLLGRVDERRIPRPGIRAGDAHATRGEVER